MRTGHRLAAIAAISAAALCAAGCSSATSPSSSASPSATAQTPLAALDTRLATLSTCTQGSSGLAASAAAVCYQGLAYSLDAVTWPASATGEATRLRTAALTAATCLRGTASCASVVNDVQAAATRLRATLSAG
jgi:hypothetical protein